MKAEHVNQRRRRHKALRWFFQAERRYGPIVPVASLQWMLGVSQTRASAVVRSGRFTLLAPPGGGKFDRFVPVYELVEAPFAAEVGRRGVFGVKNRAKSSEIEDLSVT